MSDVELEMALKNIKSIVNRTKRTGEVHDPLIREALGKVSNSKLTAYFATRIGELNEALGKAKSQIISGLLENCITETEKAKTQYRKGQLRPMILLLNNDISICTMLNEGAERVTNYSDREELKQALNEMRQKHELIQAYLNLGPVSSEEAIMLHLDLTDWLTKHILSPVHWKQHFLTAMDFAKATAGLIPGFGYLEYLKIINKSVPSDRRRINLVVGDESVFYWEQYLLRIAEWEKASAAFQYRIQDSLLYMAKTINDD